MDQEQLISKMSSHSCMVHSALRERSYIIGITSLIVSVYGIYQAAINFGDFGFLSPRLIFGFFSLVTLISSILLIIGISKEIVKLIRAYVVVQVVVLVGITLFGCIVIGMTLVIGYIDNETQSPKSYASLIWHLLVIIIFYIYFIIVVRSYAITVEEKNKTEVTV